MRPSNIQGNGSLKFIRELACHPTDFCYVLLLAARTAYACASLEDPQWMPLPRNGCSELAAFLKPTMSILETNSTAWQQGTFNLASSWTCGYLDNVVKCRKTSSQASRDHGVRLGYDGPRILNNSMYSFRVCSFDQAGSVVASGVEGDIHPGSCVRLRNCKLLSRSPSGSSNLFNKTVTPD